MGTGSFLSGDRVSLSVEGLLWLFGVTFSWYRARVLSLTQSALSFLNLYSCCSVLCLPQSTSKRWSAEVFSISFVILWMIPSTGKDLERSCLCQLSAQLRS